MQGSQPELPFRSADFIIKSSYCGQFQLPYCKVGSRGGAKLLLLSGEDYHYAHFIMMVIYKSLTKKTHSFFEILRSVISPAQEK